MISCESLDGFDPQHDELQSSPPVEHDWRALNLRIFFPRAALRYLEFSSIFINGQMSSECCSVSVAAISAHVDVCFPILNKAIKVLAVIKHESIVGHI
jgi:hypothetical protein